MFQKLKKLGLISFFLFIISCSNDKVNENNEELEIQKNLIYSSNILKENESKVKSYIPLSFSKHIEYEYEGNDKNYSFNILIDNGDTLKEVDNRLFLRGMFGSFQYKQPKKYTPPQQITMLKLSKMLSEEVNLISLDMYQKSQKVKFQKVNSDPFTVISFEKQNPLYNYSISNEYKVDPIIEKLEKLKSLYINKNYKNFILNYKTINIEISFPEYNNQNSIRDLFYEIENLAFENGFIKMDGIPIPILVFDKSLKQDNLRVKKKFLNNLYNKSVSLSEDDQIKFVFSLFLIEKFNPILLENYYNPELLISNYEKVLSDIKVLESIKKLISLNDGNSDILISMFKQFHTNFDEKNNYALKLLIANKFERML